ncbi:hypothetical protein [Vibrio aestuarianus]|uniref:hypothetical protein n=1 Tax=Vibrio aestuarianus TaxID=28171 RepID=UPI00237CF04F|nr:hypothetical protein [Vibrio aestuarianus]MDE1259957.1 hypothetical protein [Vibrio aestuarianus]
MKSLFSTIVVVAVMSSPIFSEKGYAYGDENQSMGGSMMMEMTNREQVADMSEQMQKMLKIMDKIKGETDPEKRQQLMQEHMQAMQEGMQMMNKGMPMQDSMKMTEHQGKGMSDKMGEPDMMKRMDMMEERMGMMQMMMGQMIEHESEAKY